MSEDMKPLSSAEIEALRELEAKANTAPWDDDFLICFEREDRALIAAMRNALPRILAMLTQPADAVDAELVHAGRAEIARGECVRWPADAAVREAVEKLGDDTYLCIILRDRHYRESKAHIRTLLSYVRAAQTQVAELEENNKVLNGYYCEHRRGDDHGHEWCDFRTLAAQPPRLTGERLEAVKWARRAAKHYGVTKLVAAIDAAFPELEE